MATARVICAGFGGQGVMSMGQLLTYAGMLEEKDKKDRLSGRHRIYGRIALSDF